MALWAKQLCAREPTRTMARSETYFEKRLTNEITVTLRTTERRRNAATFNQNATCFSTIQCQVVSSGSVIEFYNLFQQVNSFIFPVKNDLQTQMQPRAVACFDRRAAPRKTASIERDHSANGGDHRCTRAQKKAARKFERPSPINTIEESQLFS